MTELCGDSYPTLLQVCLRAAWKLCWMDLSEPNRNVPAPKIENPICRCENKCCLCTCHSLALRFKDLSSPAGKKWAHTLVQEAAQKDKAECPAVQGTSSLGAVLGDGGAETTQPKGRTISQQLEQYFEPIVHRSTDPLLWGKTMGRYGLAGQVILAITYLRNSSRLQVSTCFQQLVIWWAIHYCS